MDITRMNQLIAENKGRILIKYFDQAFLNATASGIYIQPPNHRVIWWVLGGRITNGDDVQRNVTLYYNDPEFPNTAGVIVHTITNLAAAGSTNFPCFSSVTTYANAMFPLCLQFGHTLLYLYFASGGASTGGTTVQRFVVFEEDVN